MYLQFIYLLYYALNNILFIGLLKIKVLQNFCFVNVNEIKNNKPGDKHSFKKGSECNEMKIENSAHSETCLII